MAKASGMADEADRMARAGNYVLGLMNDAERESAERDLENDAAFRDAVVTIAERMHLFDLGAKAEPASEALWQAISSRIAELPQMRGARPADAPPPPGRLDQSHPVRRLGLGLHSVPGWRAFAIAAGLIAACAIGYLAGRAGW